MKDLIKKSGIQVAEFAELCGVTRAAVYFWYNGTPISDSRKARVDKIITAVEAALKAKDLPISRSSRKHADKKAEMDKVKVVIVKHLKLLAAGG